MNPLRFAKRVQGKIDAIIGINVSHMLMPFLPLSCLAFQRLYHTIFSTQSMMDSTRHTMSIAFISSSSFAHVQKISATC